MKITRALGLLVPVFALLLVPFAAQGYYSYPRVLEWYQINGPGERGKIVVSPSEVSEIAVGRQGTVYALDRANAKIYQSQNSGTSWEDITDRLINAGVGLPASRAAIAPDSDSVVALVTDSGAAVYLTTDGGNTWRDTGLSGQTGVIQAVAISRQYSSSGESLREIAIGTAVWGDASTSGQVWVLKLGQLPFWQNQGLVIDPAQTGGEVAALAYSPDYPQDKTLLVAAATGADVAADYQNRLWLCAGARDPVSGATAWDTISPVAVAAAGDGTGVSISATLALPANYSGQSEATRRVFLSYDRTPDAGDDVYLIDDASVKRRNVNGGTDVNLSSIAYSGTTSSGKLLAGYVNPISGTKTVEVKRTSNPFASPPTWQAASTPPSGPGNARLNFGSGNDTVYCGTGQSPGQALDESAFSASTDGGDNWQQISLMDTTLTISDLSPTPDSATLFIATYSASGPEGIWRSTTGDERLGVYWTRQLAMDTASNRVILRLSAGYASDYTIVAAELGGTLIAISHDRGNAWRVRQAPGSIIDLAVADSSNIYVALADGKISVTNNDARFWEDPVDTSLDSINMLSLAPDRSILAGSTNGDVAYAPPGSTRFTVFSEFGSGDVWVAADTAFLTNRITYQGSANRIFRKDIDGAGTELIHSLATNRQITGLASFGGALYAAWYDPIAGTSGVERCLEPTALVTEWDTMNAGFQNARFDTAPQALKASGAAATTLWAIDSLAQALVAYDDVLAGTRPVPHVPETVTAEPVSGRNREFSVTWSALGESTEYDVEILDAAGGILILAAPVESPDVAFQPNTASPAWTIAPGQLAQGDYYVRLRIRNQQSGDQVRSLWSLPVKFTVTAGTRVVTTYAGLTLTSPNFGAAGLPTNPAFTWAPAVGTSEYELVLSRDAGFSQPVAGTPVITSHPAWQYPGKLDYDTTYFWRVRAAAPAKSEWSAAGSFTTMSPLEETPSPEGQTPTVSVAEPLVEVIISPPVTAPPSTTGPAPRPLIPQPLFWLMIGIGTALVIALISLIVASRR